MVEDDRDIDIETDGDDADMNGRMGLSKRYHHNELERKRRDHIKDSFSLLRDIIPAVAGEKISRALILNKASDFIKEMKIKNQQHEEEIETLRQSNFILEEQVKLLQKSRSSGSTESAEKILQSLSGQISEKMKSYTASRPTWEEKNAQIASRLQNSILTQNLSVKSAQNFIDKFVHKQATSTVTVPASLVEPSSYYAAPMSSSESPTEPQDSDCSSTDLADTPSGSNIIPDIPVQNTILAGKVLASPITPGSAAIAAKIPRGVVTATPVTTQTPASVQQQPTTTQQQGAINPTAISLANALKALAAAQSRQQMQKKSSSSSSSSVVAEKMVTPPTVNRTPLVTSEPLVHNKNKIAPINVSVGCDTPEVTSNNENVTAMISSQAAPHVQVNTPTNNIISAQVTNVSTPTQEELCETELPETSGQHVSLNAILGTNLSPEAERLLNALITSLQPSSSSIEQIVPAAQSLAVTSAISTGALSFCNTASSELQGIPQYAPFPSSGTRTTAEQHLSSTDDHFIDHDDTSQLLQNAGLVDVPLSESTDLADLCDLDAFTSSSQNKRPLELSDSLFTGSSIKRPHLDSQF